MVSHRLNTTLQAGFFTGFIYRQGSVDEALGGIGAGKMGTRIYQLVNGKLTETGKNIVTNFGNVGVFGNYSYGALNSDMGVNYFTAAGAMTSWTAPDDEVCRRRQSTRHL